jgi:polyhydroxybutyrate depolymerase
MRSLAEADTFILIYPQGSCLDGLSHWNACPLGGDNKSDADDFGKNNYCNCIFNFT